MIVVWQEFIGEEAEFWAETLPAWRLPSHHRHHWNMKYHWSPGMVMRVWCRGEVWWGWDHCFHLAWYRWPQGYSQFPKSVQLSLSVTFWRKCDSFDTIHSPFLKTNDAVHVYLAKRTTEIAFIAEIFYFFLSYTTFSRGMVHDQAFVRAIGTLMS